MLAAALAALAAAVAIGPSFLAPIRPTLVAIPDEPGATVLLEAAVYQAVAADLDGDGAREIVVLTHGDGSAIAASAWRGGDAGWRRIGMPLEVVPGASIPGVAWLGTPIRMLVRAVGAEERVTLVRQPSYRDPDTGSGCCLLLDDLVLGPGGLRLVQAAPGRSSVEAIRVVDLDGDGTDELVTTRSVPPLGDTSYPTEAHVMRWTGGRFSITTTRLEVGSGDTPFRLGDSDGRPGDELAVIATLGRRALYRVSLDLDDHLQSEDAGLVAEGAMAVPLTDGRGIALLTARGTLSVHAWPAGEPLGAASGEVPMGAAELLGVVEVAGVPSLLVRQRVDGDRLHAFGLPGLAPPRFGAVTRSPAAAAFASGPVAPYVGALPGGGPDGRPVVLYGGRLLGPGEGGEPMPFSGLPFATLAGAQPIGLVGRGAPALALLHGAEPLPPIDPAGGRLDAPSLQASAAVSVAPYELVREPELDGAALHPPPAGAALVGTRRSIVVGSDGFTARIDAPAGARVFVAASDPSTVAAVLAVPVTGSLEVAMRPPPTVQGGGRYRALLGVTTPAGHSYLATWEVRVLDAAPAVTATVTTVPGSAEVEVAGGTAPYVTITVDGQPVTIDQAGRFRARVALPPWPTEITLVATDPIGNVASRTLTGVGWFDYRLLPWIPIVAAGVAAAGVALYLRVPRAVATPRRPDDDGVLEELEPD